MGAHGSDGRTASRDRILEARAPGGKLGSVPEPSAVPAGPHISSVLTQPPTTGAQGTFHQKQMASPTVSSAALPCPGRVRGRVSSCFRALARSVAPFIPRGDRRLSRLLLVIITHVAETSHLGRHGNTSAEASKIPSKSSKWVQGPDEPKPPSALVGKIALLLVHKPPTGLCWVASLRWAWAEEKGRESSLIKREPGLGST